MVETPDDLLTRYVDAGCELIIVHAEACTHLHRTLGAHPRARRHRARWRSTRPPRRAMVEHVLDLCDVVLVMTVNPGFGGQAYIATMEPKIARDRRLIDDDRGLEFDLEVDGGIGPDTVAGAAGAGANVLVAGSALFRDPEGLEHAVTESAGAGARRALPAERSDAARRSVLGYSISPRRW